jgi:hypothetical protein
VMINAKSRVATMCKQGSENFILQGNWLFVPTIKLSLAKFGKHLGTKG